MASAASPSSLRISLREFLLLVTAIVVGLCALIYGNALWLATVAALTMLAFMREAVISLVDRGPRQAFALGFLACLVPYLSIFLVETEIHPYQGRFPTTRVLRQFFETVRQRLYVDEANGDRVLHKDLPPGARVIEDSSWAATPPASRGGSVMWELNARPRGTAASPGIVFRRIGDMPPRQQFMPTGHLLWGLLFGYLGGHYGKHVHCRRMSHSYIPNTVAT